MTQQADRMDFSQSYEANRRAFISRLVANGWIEAEAAAEYDCIQEEEDESGY